MNIVLKYFSDFTAKQLQQFTALEALYKNWNEKINVISRKDIDSLYEKHVLHSLSIAAVFDLTPGMRVLDLGTGGGFPGIPLAIFFPEVEFCLADSIKKKLSVIDAVALEAGITNITTRHTRVEEIKDQKFDLVVSRAVAPLKELWRWSKPLLKKNIHSKPTAVTTPGSGDKLIIPNGLVCLKGGDLLQEIAESNCKPRQVEVYDIFQEAFFKGKYLLYVAL